MPDLGYFTCGQAGIYVCRPSFPFHPPEFKEGKTGPDTRAKKTNRPIVINLFQYVTELWKLIFFTTFTLWILRNTQAGMIPVKADFKSSHEAPRSSLRVMHEHFYPITMLNSSF
jgi:hypothetical protein